MRRVGRSRSDRGGSTAFGCAALVLVCAVLGLWGVVGYVAFHFISKAW